MSNEPKNQQVDWEDVEEARLNPNASDDDMLMEDLNESVWDQEAYAAFLMDRCDAYE
jgi:hypothetical protein